MGIAVATSCLLGRVHQLRHPRADHDPGGRHRRPHRAQRRGGADLARRDRQPVVAVVGRDDDGRGLAREPARPPGDLQGALQARREGRRRRRPRAHRVPAVDLGRGHPDLQRARRVGHARVLRRAVAARVHLAAAHLRALDHLHQLDGAHLVDAHRGAVQDHAVLDGRDRPHQPGEQPDPGGHDGGDRRRTPRTCSPTSSPATCWAASRASRRSAT